MQSEILVAVCSLIGTTVGTFSGIKVISYRLEQLEKRVEKHNNLIERQYKLEERQELADEQRKVANRRIDDLESEVKELAKQSIKTY